IGTGGAEPNYTGSQGHAQGDYSTTDQQTDRSLENETDAGTSINLSVPTKLRREEDTIITVDDVESIYNHNYATQSLMKSANINVRPNYLLPNYTNQSATKQPVKIYKSTASSPIIIGHCQIDFQPLDPNSLCKPTAKSLLAEQRQFYTSSQVTTQQGRQQKCLRS
ncbi:unnamed protein product, partial [Rotaria magnacalcarata]